LIRWARKPFIGDVIVNVDPRPIWRRAQPFEHS
jgi:hypothetical protein